MSSDGMVRVGKSSTWWKYVSTAVRGSVRRKVTPVSRRVELYTWVRKTDCKWSNFFQSILMRLDEYFPLKNMTSWAQTTSKTACADFPLDVDDCLRLEWSCENGGQAVDTGKSCECQCAAGYTGEYCQTGLLLLPAIWDFRTKKKDLLSTNLLSPMSKIRAH